VDCRGRGWQGKQQPTFTRRKEAEEEASRVAQLVKDHGSVGGAEYHEDLELVKVLRNRLAPFDIKLEDAVDIFIKTKAEQIAAEKSVLLGKVADEWLESKRNPNLDLSEDTIEQVADICKRLEEGFGRDRHLATITKQNIDEDLAKRKISQEAKKIYLRMFRSFFKFAIIDMGYLTKNPCDGLKIKTNKKTTLIYSKDSILTMLGRVLEDEALIPFVCLSLFTGLRPYGLKRIKWDDIHIDERKYMYVSKFVSKTCEHHTPIHENLIEWIKPYVGKPIIITNHPKRLAKILKGLEKQFDIFRHTTISYFMGELNNIYKVSEHFGNSPYVIKRCYQRPVTDTDTKWFWSLTPTKVKELLAERDKKNIIDV
jgi:integrase